MMNFPFDSHILPFLLLSFKHIPDFYFHVLKNGKLIRLSTDRTLKNRFIHNYSVAFIEKFLYMDILAEALIRSALQSLLSFLPQTHILI